MCDELKMRRARKKQLTTRVYSIKSTPRHAVPPQPSAMRRVLSSSALRVSMPRRFWSEVSRALSLFLLFFMPLYWAFILSIVAWFSIGWSLAIGAILFTYPHILWQRQKETRPKRWPGFSKLFEFFLARVFEYFPITLHKDVRASSNQIADPAAPYLFGYHPHGCECFGLFALAFPKESNWNSLFPAMRPCFIGVANSLLCVPLLGTIFGWLGFMPASRFHMQAAIQDGGNIALVPGGIAEMLEFDENDEVVFLRSRRGFIRFALEQGVNLVPVYGFGENITFIRYRWLKSLRLYLSRRLGITVQLWRGRWWSLIPFNTPIDVVVGPVIPVEKTVNPSADQVQVLLDRYIGELQALYEANKELYGYSNRKLIIL